MYWQAATEQISYRNHKALIWLFLISNIIKILLKISKKLLIMHVANHILLMCSTFGIKYFVVIGIMLNHSPRCADTDQQINNQRIIVCKCSVVRPFGAKC